ncbi:FAD-dependent oxidoreductase [Streptomyces sp. PTY087I2]|uniref:FAD-dependent oxidoreductase n=1 Tax=Streptomyces sp. PTY087I2 TaxID=1819298 RepID=UPI0008289355|nr:FAD-dependent oxidoreductase [Streptomyces sp. PTY087I2]OCC10588.1 Monomeric sarcosine oxidase [Streptomyces sp. PTY087I2]
MTRWDAEAAVVGLGAWGASALWRLAARGVDVLGFDQTAVGRGGDSRQAGSTMFRLSCSEQPGLVALARRSRELWAELEDTARTQLFVPSGGLVVGPQDGPTAGGALRTARDHDIDVRTFSARALRFQYPRHTGVPDHHIGVWEPSAGLLRPEAAVHAAVSAARAAGARVFEYSRITAIDFVPGGVVLRSAQRDIRVRQVVVTAGPWLSSLVPDVALETYRAPVTWFRPLEPDAGFSSEEFPVFVREFDDGRVLHGSGSEGDQDIRLSLEDHGTAAKPTDPDDVDPAVRYEDWSALAKLLPAKLPGLRRLPARAAASWTTRTPDAPFVLGTPDGDSRLMVAGGSGARGLQHSTGIGDALADLLLGAGTGDGPDVVARGWPSLSTAVRG